ncbi:MAG: peptidylprolyl isomerase [Candidatus Pacearchaeota archaeon]|nr:peptidylprolyl isomerase [Candidatus Pacearchaeota archaeon]
MDIQKLKKRYSESYLQDIFDEKVTKILILETYRGTIFIELFHKDVPLVKEIIAKALLGELDGMVFYNCNPYFVQLRKKVEEKETAEKIIRPYLKNVKGTVGLTNSKKQPSKALLDHFYICIKDLPEIDGEYTIIGRVIKGLDVLNKIWDGNTVRRCYIEKGYVEKPRGIRKLHFVYWIGLSLIIFFAFWLFSLHLEILKEFQKEAFGQIFTDKISKERALYILFSGLALIIFSLIVSSLRARVEIGVPKEKGRKEEEKELMKKIEEKRIALVREIEKYKEKELEREKEEKLKAELEKMIKTIEEERKKIEKERTAIETERKKIEEERKRIEELKEKMKEEILEKEVEKERKKEKEKKEDMEKEEREKMIEIMKKPHDLKKEIKKRSKEEIKKEVLPKIAERTETQLDVLYELLEKHKSLKLSEITQMFKIEKDEAIEWCNILVEHGLAELKYPTFGEPILIRK